MATSAPPPNTGPRNIPSITLASIRARFQSLDSRIKYLEKNRFPIPTQMHEIANAPQVQMAQPGHAPVLSPIGGAPTGTFQPSPVLATMLFHQPGSLVAATSDPFHARYACNIVGVAADLATYGSGDVVFDILVNGSSIQTVTMTSDATGFIPVTSHTALNPYTDLVAIETTGVGSGSSGLVVHVELAVDVNKPPS